MDRQQTKNELLEFLNRPNPKFSVRDVIAFMSLTRNILEYDNIKENWKLINFYCNWTVHSQLSHTNYGHTQWIFDLLANTLNLNWGNNQKIIEDVSLAVGLETLKSDFHLFLRYCFTQEEINDENTFLCNDFMETIAYIVMNRQVLNKTNVQGTYTSGKLEIKHSISDEDVYISKISLTSHFVENKEIGGLSIFVHPSPPLHDDNNTPFQIFQINQLNNG